MNAISLLISYLATSIAAGVLGGAAMLGAMGLMTRGGLSRGNMVEALGGLITKSRANAFRVGLIAHALSAVVFAMIYAFGMLWLGATGMPQALVLGLAGGFFHGLIVSLMLVWVVAEGHPFEEYNEAGLAVGVAHLFGHVVYGAVVGLVIGISPL
ncbi:hypothetical protein [Opitutus terrae]|uniref:Uncharacterized protein n=1 Tax=Opitutus terrae (strain DSM 11246 / JCM 15787 / PB90-1) TaxID=452637 RepID=B1ZTN4_OPITP|nr:hypothetical protein [Opitutus terrae]ACB74820.1 hypothetical protein Oter_1536 [Opitutus terrae PB90-1]